MWSRAPSFTWRALPWAASPVNRPLTLFLAAGLFSWMMGLALWDPAVPQSSYFWLVSLAQWALFLFAALAFWLTANLARDEAVLRRLTWTFLWLGGGLAILGVYLISRAVVKIRKFDRMLHGISSKNERVAELLE